MSSSKFTVVAAWSLFAAPALAQIPVRLLDSNGLFVYDTPARVRGGLACGTGAGGSWPEGAFWDATGSHVLTPLPGNVYGSCADFNDAGDVVGESGISLYYRPTATLWRGGTAIDLNTFVTGGAAVFLGTANAIDSKGRVAGASSPNSAASPDRGYLLDNGFVTDLGALPGASFGVWPLHMNEHLQIVGYDQFFHHAVLWDNGTLIDLHDPAQITGSISEAQSINRAGRIVGYANFKVSPTVERQSAVVWDQGVVTDLGASLPSSSIAYGINEFDFVVGTYYDTSRGSRACIFENGGATDLNTLIAPGTGWTLEIAYDVDNEGRIVGSGLFGGQYRAFILEPTCNGFFAIYGTGCPGSVGIEPRLDGLGCPSPDQDFGLLVHKAVPGSIGFSFIGSGTGVFPVKPGCDLQVLPLVLPPILVAADGFGEIWTAANLPSGTPPFDLYLQVMFLAPGSHLVSATKPIQIHFQ